MDLPRQLRQLRIRAGHTQRSLAERLGVHYTAVSHIEQGTRVPSVELLNKWVEICGAALVIMAPDDARLLTAVRGAGANSDLLIRIGELLPRLNSVHHVTLAGILDAWEKADITGQNEEIRGGAIKITS